MFSRDQLTVRVERDYDGYFESIVRGMIEKKEEFNHSEIVISSGPWRPYAVEFQSSGETILLDFYSALRAGFGSLSESEIDEITRKL